MATAAPTNTQVLTFQGIEVPAEAVNPRAFFALTRRHRTVEYNKPFAGLGFTDVVELRKSDIIAGLYVRFSGQLVVTLGTGTASSTMRWPYDLVKAFRFTANGQSNLINVSGLKLKARQHMTPDVDDRGVTQTVGAGTASQGTLSTGSESWGVGAGAALTSGTYDVELDWFVPIADDENDLAGAIFAQTSAMDLTLSIDYEQAGNLFPVTGNATVALTGNTMVTTEKFSIPTVGGNFVLPDLSMFHGLIQTRASNVLANGDNELRIIGQGAGKQLLRLFFQVYNGNPAVPLVANATNYGPQGWRYGSNETPELYADGRSMRQQNEHDYNSDIGAVWGFLCHDFAIVNAFRDAVDMGQTSELRIYSNIPSSVSLSSPAIEYVQETMFSAGA